MQCNVVTFSDGHQEKRVNPLGMKSIGMDDVLKSLIAPESVAILDEIQRQLDIHDEFRNLRSKLKSGKMI